MNFAKRLTRIETSLTPKQAVLLWLKETLPLGRDDWTVRAWRAPLHETPRFRISLMVEKAVRDSLGKKGLKPEFIARVALEAQKEADFLFVLIRNVRDDVASDSLLRGIQLLLLCEKLDRMLEHFVEHERFDPEAWDKWQAALINTITPLWQQRAIIAAISARFYDQHPILFAEEENGLEQDIRMAEALATQYNSLEGGLPSWTALDLIALQSSVEAEVPAAVDRRVIFARASSLRDFGEEEAARDLEEPIVLWAIENLHSSGSEMRGGGGD